MLAVFKKKKKHFQIVFSRGPKNKSQRDSEGRRHTHDRITGPRGRKKTHVKETSLKKKKKKKKTPAGANDPPPAQILECFPLRNEETV